jgi:hypothetical protein
MTVRQAIQLTIYTTRSLKRDETARYIRLVRAAGDGDPDTAMRDAEVDGLESDGIDDVSDLRQVASRGKLPARIPRLEAP